MLCRETLQIKQVCRTDDWCLVKKEQSIYLKKKFSRTYQRMIG